MKATPTPLILAVFTLIVVSTVTAQKTTEAVPDSSLPIMGSLEGRTYRNQLLKFELTLPDEGVILNQAEIEVYKQAGLDQLKSSNAKNNQLIDASAKREVIILNYAAKPIGMAHNTVLVIGVIKQAPSVTSSMVVAATLKGISASGKFELTRSLVDFDIARLKSNGLEGIFTAENGQKIKQRILVLIRHGYSLSFVLNSMDDDGLNIGQELLNKIRFISK